MLGKKLRMNRIFKEDGNALIVAMDHGAFAPFLGLEEPEKIIKEVVDGGADAILINYGLANQFAQEIKGRVSLILRLDGGSTVIGESAISQLFKVEDAVRIGADAVICMGYIGSKMENNSLKNLANIAVNCEKFGIPLLAEMIPTKKEPDVRDIKLAARVGAELGADVIKTIFMGTKETYKEVVENCFVPIVILGGKKIGNEDKLLGMIEEAIESGVRGVCMGRNIWQSREPKKLMGKIVNIIHAGLVKKQLRISHS